MIDYGFETDVLYSATHGVRIIDHYPIIEYGIRQYTRTEVPGRKGTLTEFDGTYTDTTVSMDCDIMLYDGALEIDAQYQKFVSELQNSRRLVLEGLKDRYFRIKTIEISDYMRDTDNSITFSLLFTCEPGVYFFSGDQFVSPKGYLINSYSESEPIYKISGSGVCTLSVNDVPITANVEDELYIDTARMLAYLSNGNGVNNIVSGNYDELCLKPGRNEISVTNGFDLKVKPQWRWLQP